MANVLRIPPSFWSLRCLIVTYVFHEVLSRLKPPIQEPKDPMLGESDEHLATQQESNP